MGLTLRDVAAKLGDISFSAISLWEKAADKPIPTHAVKSLLGETTVTLPINDLVDLVDYARLNNRSAIDVLQEALREYIASHRPVVPAENIIRVKYADIAPPGEALKVAEGEPTIDITLPSFPAQNL